jgi:hypothetical protein
MLVRTLLVSIIMTSYLSYADEQSCSLKTGSQLDELERLMNSIHNADNCDRLVQEMRLNDKNKDYQNELTPIKKSHDLGLNLAKIFSDKKSRGMIDLYDQCGKKSGSHRLVKNLVLINARESCLMPAPPGHLSWEDATKLAEEIGNRYQNNSLLDLNRKKEDIKKDATLTFVKSVTRKKIASLIPNKKMGDELFAKIISINNLQNSRPQDVMDYLKYQFTPEVSIELSEKVFPLVMEEKFSEKLPKTWDKKKKLNYLTNLKKLGSTNLAACLKPFKQKIGYGLAPDKSFPIRKELERKYCEKNPKICSSAGCSKQKNFFSLSPKPTDIEQIQGCIFKTFETLAEEFTGDLIDSNIEEMKDLALSVEDKREVKQIGKAELRTCLAKKSIDYNTTTPEKFGNAIEECSQNVTRAVVATIFDKMKVFAEDSKSKVDELMKSSFDPCIEKIKKSPTASVSVCSTMMEISAAQIILIESLQKTAAENTSQEINGVIEQFKVCTDNVRTKAQNDLPQDPAPVLNQDFLVCSKTAIEDMAQKLSESLYSSTIKQNEDKIKDLVFAQSLAPQVSTLIKDCFKNGLSTVDTWKAFKEFNKIKGVDDLKRSCADKANAFALSNIIAHEAGSEIEKLKELNLISQDSSAQDVLREAAQSLAPISLTVKKDQTPQKLLEQIYLEKVKENPDLTASEFIDDFKEAVTDTALVAVHKEIMAGILQRAHLRGFGSLPGLEQAFTPACLKELNDRFKDEFKNEDTSKPSDLNKLIGEFVADGLIYARLTSPKGYEEVLGGIKSICADVSAIKDPKDLLKDKRLDAFYKARIQNELIKSFTDSMNESYQKGLDEIKSSPDRDTLLPFVENQKKEMQKLIQDKLINYKEFDKWISSTNLLTFMKEKLSETNSSSDEGKVEIKKAIVSELFKSRITGSFASEFTRIQLISNLGVKGYEQAKNKINDEMNNLGKIKSRAKHKILPASLRSLKKHWTPSSLASDFNWSGMAKADREKLIALMFEKGILPEVSGEEANMDAIKDGLTEALNKAPPSPYAQPRRGSPPKPKSFNQKLSEKVSSDVKKEVGFWDVVFK